MGKGRVTRPHSTKQDRYAGYSGSLPWVLQTGSHLSPLGFPDQADTAQARKAKLGYPLWAASTH